MSRFLFVTPPFVAHVNPMVSIATQLTARGHDVAWVTYSSVEDLLPPGSNVYFVQDQDLLQAAEELIREAELALAQAYKSFVEDIVIPFARSMLSTVEEAIAGFKPDALFVDLHAMAGAIAARKAAIPWATSSPSGQLFTDVFEEMDKVKAWRKRLFDDLQKECGLDPIDAPDCSPHLVLLYTTTAFVGEDRDYPPHFRFVGAAIRERADVPDFPWRALRPGKRVLVSLGSLIAGRGERFFKVLQEALKDADLQVIVSAPPEFFPDPPPNFVVREWLPQLRLFAEVDAMITHGGSTVNEALAFAVPMVVTPMTTDQFVYARKVVESGAGVRVRFRRVSPGELREAVMTVIDDPAYSEAALRIQKSFAAAGGTRAAADALEALAGAARQ